MMTVLGGFHHRIARCILGMKAWRDDGGEWKWTLVDAVLEVKGIWAMREYVRRWQVKIAEYDAGRPLYKLCTGVDRMEGPRRLLS